MSMRLYHRRSSSSREKLQIPGDLAAATAARLHTLGACGHRDSLSIAYSRPRSQSLFPGSQNSLGIPSRSRSQSFSGPSKPLEGQLSASEEEHIFQCYTRVMYMLLGGLAAVTFGLVLYGIHNFMKLA